MKILTNRLVRSTSERDNGLSSYLNLRGLRGVVVMLGLIAAMLVVGGRSAVAADFVVAPSVPLTATARTLSNSRVSVEAALAGGTLTGGSLVSGYVAMSSGAGHTLLVKKDGSLWAWGKNDKGQLGDGTNINRNAPVRIGSGSNWLAVAAGFDFSLAIKTDGTLWSWGANGVSQLGDGLNSDKTIPAKVGTLNTWRAISAGYAHGLAVNTAGEVWAWGSNGGGQLGFPYKDTNAVSVKSSPTKVPDANFGTFVVGIPVNNSGVDIVAAGFAHSAIVKSSDNTLWTWGANPSGQLGDDSTTDNYLAYPARAGAASTKFGADWLIFDTGWKYVACGYGHTVATKTDGTLYTWGDNSHSQLARTTNAKLPVQVAAGPTWDYVAAGKYHSLAVTTDYKLYAWGANDSGQLGDGLTTNLATPTQVLSTSTLGFVIPAAGDQSSAALDYTTGVVKTFGRNIEGQLADGTVQQLLVPDARISGTWKKFASGGSHVVAIKDDGTLWTWGNNSGGQLGDGTNVSHSAPIQISAETTWTDVFASTLNSAAIKGDGSLWVWGSNSSGQVGNGSTNSQLTPYQIDVADVTGWKTAALGGEYALAVSTSGNLYAWGQNTYGQLGQAKSAVAVKVPVSIDSSGDWAAVSAGVTHSLGLRGTGPTYDLYAWGQNIYGQLGTGGTDSSETPTKVGSALWKSISVGDGHSAGIDSAGNLYTWGNNTVGQLGAGNTRPSNTPTKVATSTWTRVALGTSFSAGITTGGSLWAWGKNDLGQNGDGSTINRTSPVRVGTSTDWSDLSVGETFVIAGTGTAGSLALSGWGDNSSGAIGEGTAQISPRSAVAGAKGSGTLTVVLVGGTASAVSGGTLDYNVGDKLLFTGSFSGTAPFTYQWTRDGTSISGATGPSYEVPAAVAADTGTYTVSLGNSYGTQKASSVYLSLYTAPSVQTLSPTLNIVTGNSLSLTASATGSNLSYQWKKDGSVISGATLTSYTFPNAQPANSGSYSVDVSNSKNGVTTTVNSGSIGVNVLNPIVVSGTLPSSFAVLPGDVVTLGTINASGTPLTVTGGGTIKYRWRKNLQVIADSTTPTYTISNASASDAGTYDVVVYNDASSVTSTTTVVQVKSPPVITLSPATQTVQSGRTLFLTANATGFPSPTVVWYGPGLVGVPSTSSSGPNFTLVVSGFGATKVGSYYAVATNDAGSTTSTVSTVNLATTAVIRPTILRQPTNASVQTTGSINLTVIASGTSPSYQWRLGGQTITGGTSSTLTVSGAALGVGRYTYDVVVSNSAGQVTSNTVTVSVSASAPPVITIQPKSKLVVTNTALTLSVTATNTNSYQWYKDGTIITGGTQSVYSVASATAADSGSYYVIVSNGVDTLQSSTAAVTVGNPFSNLYGSNRGAFAARVPSESALGSGPGTKEGYINLSVTRSGTVSGVYQSGLERYSFAGRFDGSGILTTTLRQASSDDQIVVSVTGSIDSPGLIVTVVKGAIQGTERTLVRLGTSDNTLTGTYTGAFGDGTTTALSGYLTANVVSLGSRVIVTYGLPTGEVASGSTQLYTDPDGAFPGLFTDLVVQVSATKKLYSTLKIAVTSLDGDAVVYKSGDVKTYDIAGCNYVPPTDGSPIAPFVSDHEEGVVNVDGNDLGKFTSLGSRLFTFSSTYSSSGGRLSLSLNPRTGLVSGVANTSATERKAINFVILQGNFRLTNVALGSGVTRDGKPVVIKPGN